MLDLPVVPFLGLSLVRLGEPLATDPPSELHVLGHYGLALSMNGAELRVFEETNNVRFYAFLKSLEC